MAAGQAESLEDVIDRRLHALNRRETGFERVVAAVAETMMQQRGALQDSRDTWVRTYLERRTSEYAALSRGRNG
jgi:hypothetical protein